MRSPRFSGPVHTVLTPSTGTVTGMRRTDAFSERLHEALHEPRTFGMDADGPHVCPTCHAPFVVPVDAVEVDTWHFSVSLFCPNCDWTGSGVYDDAALERFDLGLDAGTRELVTTLEAVAFENARDDFERFAAALRVDAILPEDF
jgi:hypothetical protein